MVLIKLFKKYPAYAYLQIASIITGLSGWAGFLAMLVLLDQITSSGIELGSLWAISGLIPLIIGFFSGVWLDRINVKKLIYITDMTSVLGYIGFILITFIHPSYAWVLFLLVRLLTILSGNINSTCKRMVLPEIVSQEDLARVNSLNYSISSTIRLSGASLGGVFLAFSSLNATWILNIICFSLAGILAILAQKHFEFEKKREEKLEKNFFKEFKEGFKHIRVNRWVSTVVLAALCTGILIGSFNLMLQQFVSNIYEAPNHVLSYLYLAEGIVSVIVGYWIASKNLLLNNRIYYGIFYGLFGIAWICFGATTNYLQGMIVLMLFAIVGAFNGPYERTTMQIEVPIEVRGRVFSIWGTTFSSAIQVGAFITGVIISILGIRFVPYITGAIETLLGLTVVILAIKYGGKMNYQKKEKAS